MSTTANLSGGSLATLPEKLRDDAIIEAVCQLQFVSPELPEVIIGRLSDVSDIDGGQDYTAVRLPWADIPAPVRQADQNLRSQPVLELRRKDTKRSVRLSENVISYHLVGTKNYCGWTAFRQELQTIFLNLFKKLKSVEVNRIGFRYINAVVKARHQISDVHELNLETQVAGKKLSGPINLNYVENNSESHITTTRVAHPRFVQGRLPENTVAVIDVEVATPTKFKVSNIEDLMEWIDKAHSYEKEAFFRLIPAEILHKLVEH